MTPSRILYSSSGGCVVTLSRLLYSSSDGCVVALRYVLGRNDGHKLTAQRRRLCQESVGGGELGSDGVAAGGRGTHGLD